VSIIWTAVAGWQRIYALGEVGHDYWGTAVTGG
jgi:hypothetical protein